MGHPAVRHLRQAGAGPRHPRRPGRARRRHRAARRTSPAGRARRHGRFRAGGGVGGAQPAGGLLAGRAALARGCPGLGRSAVSAGHGRRTDPPGGSTAGPGRLDGPPPLRPPGGRRPGGIGRGRNRCTAPRRPRFGRRHRLPSPLPPPPAHRARAAGARRSGSAGARTRPLPHPEPGLLPGGHRAGRPARGRGHLAAAHPWGGGDAAAGAGSASAPGPAGGRARHHPHLCVQRGRRPVRGQRPLARRTPRGPAPRGGGAAAVPGRDRRPVGGPFRGRHDHRDAGRGGHGRPGGAAGRRYERPTAALRPRLPRPDGRTGPLRVRVRLQMARRATADHLRRLRRLLGAPVLGAAGGRQDAGAHRHPRPYADLSPGRVAVAGVAWAQHRGIERVQVRVDGGPWQEARLGTADGVDTWRQWVWPWQATPGDTAWRSAPRTARAPSRRASAPVPSRTGRPGGTRWT